MSFYLWWIGSVLKYCKVPKYYDHDCLTMFFLLSTLPLRIQIFGKSAHLAQKCYFCQKTINKQSWKLFKVKIFDLNQICKIVFAQNHWIWNFNATELCFIFLLKFVEMLWSYKNCQKNWSWKGLGWVRIKNLLAQTIPNKIFGTKWSNPVKLVRKIKVWYLFLHVF